MIDGSISQELHTYLCVCVKGEGAGVLTPQASQVCAANCST